MFPWFQYTTIYLGPIPIQVWGFWVALGMVIALWIISKRAKTKGEKVEEIMDIAIWAIVGGLIFARLFHVLFYEPTFYLAHPLDVFKVWHGGLSSFGGLFGAVLGVWASVKRRRVDYARLSRINDILAFAAVYGWMVGRLGCVMIHDHMGRPCNCFLAIQSPDGSRLEMAILEILGMIPLAIWFFVVRKKKQPDGWFLAVLFVYYGVLRFVLDFFRATDIVGADVRYFGLTPAQYGSIVLVIAATVIGKKFLTSNEK